MAAGMQVCPVGGNGVLVLPRRLPMQHVRNWAAAPLSRGILLSLGLHQPRTMSDRVRATAWVALGHPPACDSYFLHNTARSLTQFREMSPPPFPPPHASYWCGAGSSAAPASNLSTCLAVTPTSAAWITNWGSMPYVGLALEAGAD